MGGIRVCTMVTECLSQHGNSVNGVKWTKILLQIEPTTCGNFIKINVKKRKRN